MRNALKITFAFLLSLLLAGEQTVFSGSVRPLAAPDCACVGCQKICCASRQAPAPEPATPSRTASPEQSPLFVAVLARLLTIPPSSTAELSTAYSAAPALAAALPLHQRNCIYLI